MWELDYRKDAEFFERLIKRGDLQHVPKRFFERPDLPKEFEWLMEAFWVLHSSRQSGMGIGYIPLTEIKAYAEMFDVPDVRMLVGCIRALDRIFVERESEKAK